MIGLESQCSSQRAEAQEEARSLTSQRERSEHINVDKKEEEVEEEGEEEEEGRGGKKHERCLTWMLSRSMSIAERPSSDWAQLPSLHPQYFTQCVNLYI